MPVLEALLKWLHAALTGEGPQPGTKEMLDQTLVLDTPLLPVLRLLLALSRGRFAECEAMLRWLTLILCHLSHSDKEAVTAKLLEENVVQLTSDLLSSEIGEKKYIDYQQRPALLEVLDSSFVLWGNLLGDQSVIDRCARTEQLNSKHRTCLGILSDSVCLDLMRDIATSSVLLEAAVLDRLLWVIHNLFLHGDCLAKNEELVVNVLSRC